MYQTPTLEPADLDRLRDTILSHWRAVPDLPVSPRMAPDEIRRALARFDFTRPIATRELTDQVARLLRDGNLNTSHPRYFGLFNPPALPVTLLADALVAAFNPQLAAWAHAPAANEIERHTLDWLRRRIGLPEGSTAHFTSGGQEANATALGAALTAAFPELPERGVRALPGQPVLYVSEHAHHSFHKAARQAGIGSDSVRAVGADSEHRIRPEALREAIADDRAAGRLPFLVVATAGTTATGAIDPLPAIRDVCDELALWFHVDAAWGGTALLSPRLATALDGIADADSVTWDAHKWLCVPVAAGMCFVRDPEPLHRLFQVRTGYVPPAGDRGPDPYFATAQWSRRFIGLKVFMALAWLGADGWRQLVESMASTGDRLRALLREAGWRVTNETPLPLVCAAPPDADPATLAAIARRIEERGRVWISAVTLPDGTGAIRACITSWATGEDDLRALVDELEVVHSEMRTAG